jgi:4-hydroxybenzoate polyprenyltransferase
MAYFLKKNSWLKHLPIGIVVILCILWYAHIHDSFETIQVMATLTCTANGGKGCPLLSYVT